MGYSEEEIRRYSRHLLLKEVGGVGQRRLLESTVVLVGLGGLGCPAAQYLAAAGVGRLVLADPDVVDLSNLPRQILYTAVDAGRPKVEAAAEALRRLNPGITVEPLARAATPDGIRDLVRGRTVVLEGSDSPETKFLVNDACVAEGTPLVVGGVVRWSGQVLVVADAGGCYRCVFETPPAEGEVESCEAQGVLGAAAGAVGVLMAVEACKRILGVDAAAAGRMLTMDALTGTFRSVRWSRRDGCPACACAPRRS